jgi:DNA-binding LytR/AlgR family response regulator
MQDPDQFELKSSKLPGDSARRGTLTKDKSSQAEQKDLVDRTAGDVCPTQPRLCYIIDDNSEMCLQILRKVTQYLHQPNWILKGYTKADKFMAQTKKDKPAIVMMDVELVDPSGKPIKAMDLANEIIKAYSLTQIIFFSGHAENCCGVYAAEHIYFIPKGVFSRELPLAIRKATHNISMFKENCLMVKNRDISFPMHYNDVVFIENDGRKVNIHTQTEVYSSYMSIEELALQLDSRFIHCHKSYIINIDKVKILEKSSFLMVTGDRINISQARSAKSKEKYFSHFHSMSSSYDPNKPQTSEERASE